MSRSRRDSTPQDNSSHRRALAALWQAAREQAPRSPHALRSLRMDLGEPLLSEEEWQKRGGGRILGILEREKLVTLLPPGVAKLRWWAAVVVPSLTTAGELGGLWLTGEDRREIGELWLAAGGPREKPAGLLMAHALRQPPGQLGDQLFLFLEPRVALKIQLLHLEDHTQHLPVVAAALHGETVEGMLDRRRPVVVWAKECVPQAIRHARAAGARLCISMAIHKMDTSRAADYGAIPYLEMISRQARDWREQLEEKLLALPLEEVDCFVQECGLAPGELERFLDEAGGPLRARLRAGRQTARVRMSGKTIEERGDGWWHLERGEQISNFVLRVDEVVRYSRAQETKYQGRVLIAGREVPVAITEQDRQDLAAWLEQGLLAHGQVLRVAPHWRQHLYDLALHTHLPVVREVDDRLGHREEGLYLPGYWIAAGSGEVHPRTGLEEHSLQRVTNDLEEGALADVFWAALDWLVAVTMAPRTGVRPACLALPVPTEILERWLAPSRNLLEAGAGAIACNREPARAGRTDDQAGWLVGLECPWWRRLLALCPGWKSYPGPTPNLIELEATGKMLASQLLDELSLAMRGQHPCEGDSSQHVRDAQVTQTLGELLAYLHADNYLSLVPEKFYDPTPARGHLVADGESLWFSCRMLERVLSRPVLAGPGAPPLRHGYLVEALARNKLFAGERTIRGVRGICVPQHWFRSMLLRCKWSYQDRQREAGTGI